MPYDSTIHFTFDTICPWTYLAKKRLTKAVSNFNETSPLASKTTFTFAFHPYQLYPDAPAEGEDKRAWYRRSRYGDSEDKLAMYETLMSAYGTAVGIDFKFRGLVANTLDAHRVVQAFQERHGGAAAEKVVMALYERYFEKEMHPSSEQTLIEACIEAGIDEAEAKELVGDHDEHKMETRMAIQEQAGNGIDSVPYVVVEGRKRDVTLQGAREVEEYVKVLERVAKENE